MAVGVVCYCTPSFSNVDGDILYAALYFISYLYYIGFCTSIAAVAEICKHL